MEYIANKPVAVCPFSLFHKDPFERLERVNSLHEPLLVYRPEGESFIVMSITYFHELQAPTLAVVAEQVRRASVKKNSRDWWARNHPPKP